MRELRRQLALGGLPTHWRFGSVEKRMSPLPREYTARTILWVWRNRLFRDRWLARRRSHPYHYRATPPLDRSISGQGQEQGCFASRSRLHLTTTGSLGISIALCRGIIVSREQNIYVHFIGMGYIDVCNVLVLTIVRLM